MFVTFQNLLVVEKGENIITHIKCCCHWIYTAVLSLILFYNKN